MAEATTPLRAWREARGYTLEEVSALTGYSAATLSGAETGRRRLSPAAKVTISRRLGAPLRELFPVRLFDDQEQRAA